MASLVPSVWRTLSTPLARPFRRSGAHLHRGALAAGLFLLLGPSSLAAQEPPTTVQPGAPGEPSRVLEPRALDSAALPTYVAADVRFMRRMIPHHEQALEMAALVGDRTGSEDLRRLARRIEISQRDEIALMERWLEERGEKTPDDEEMDAAEREDEGHRIAGMLSPGEMEELAAARGAAFERRFLEFMIRHHQGALEMVEELFDTPGAGQAPAVNHFASEAEADQEMEIRRMRRMLEAL